MKDIHYILNILSDHIIQSNLIYYFILIHLSLNLYVQYILYSIHLMLIHITLTILYYLHIREVI